MLTGGRVFGNPDGGGEEPGVQALAVAEVACEHIQVRGPASARLTFQANGSRVARSTMSWPVSWTKQNRSPTPANQQRTTAVSGSESALATATADGGCGLVSYPVTAGPAARQVRRQ